jgi:hypothetical protein
MIRKYPQRPDSHNLQTESERFFQKSLPQSWTCQKVSDDYGVDFSVEIFDGKRCAYQEPHLLMNH